MAQPGAVTAVVIGAGHRGRFAYGGQALAHPERLRIVAVAEPDAARREAMAREHGLGADARFGDWRELLARPQLADVAIVATSDTLHVAPALAALARGYHVLLEKPIAPEPQTASGWSRRRSEAGRILQIGHVLRYTPFYRRVHEIVASGQLGRVWHIALRSTWAPGTWRTPSCAGRFRNREIAAPILLAKSCHDLDLLVWLAQARPARVASFGRLSGYTAARAPQGAPERCTQGCPVQASCAHDAVRFYLGPDEALATVWPWSDVSPDPSREARRRALEIGPLRALRLSLRQRRARSPAGRGRVRGWPDRGVQPARPRRAREPRAAHHGGARRAARRARARGDRALPPRLAREQREQIAGSPLGHFGGDVGLVAHFVDVVRRGAPQALRAAGREALEGHLLGFAAERAREQGRVVDFGRLSPRDRGGGERLSEPGDDRVRAPAAGGGRDRRRRARRLRRRPLGGRRRRRARRCDRPRERAGALARDPSRASSLRSPPSGAARRSTPTEQRRLLDRMIDEELLLQRGIALGLDRYEPSARGAIVSALVASVTADAETGEPDEAALRAFYAANAQRFGSGPRLRGRRGVRRGGGAARGARARAGRGARPAAASGRGLRSRARASSATACVAELPPGALDLDTLRDYLGPTAARAAAELAVGEVAGPVRGSAGYFVLVLRERRAEEPAPFESVREQVRAEYLRGRGETALSDYLAGMREEARIRILDPELAAP